MRRHESHVESAGGINNRRPARGEVAEMEALLRLSSRELDDLFRRSDAGARPDGRADGLFLLAPGTPGAPVLAGLLGLAWRGKNFDAGSGTMVNRVLPIGIEAVKAHIREEPSRLDRKPCHVLDYSRTSLIAGGVRDEIREVAPGLYLGLVYWIGLRVGRFALCLTRATDKR
ncbi:hypothetical protein GGE65_004009 [Skermanella aerolata]|uniref:hypothetical protein n=1 Tax=Skermanella aerolata TaxID=393310 RepID=UPI003D1FCFEF